MTDITLKLTRIVMSCIQDREQIDPLLLVHFPPEGSPGHTPLAIVEAIPRGHLGAFDQSKIAHTVDILVEKHEELKGVFVKKEGSRVFFLCLIDDFSSFKQWIGGKDPLGAGDDLFLSVSKLWKETLVPQKRVWLLEYIRCLIEFEIRDRCARVTQVINFRLNLPESLLRMIAFGFFHYHKEWREEYSEYVGAVFLKCPPRDLLSKLKVMLYDVGIFILWLKQYILPLVPILRRSWFFSLFRDHIFPGGRYYSERDLLSILLSLLHSTPLVVLRGLGIPLGHRQFRWLSDPRNISSSRYWLTPKEYVRYFILNYPVLTLNDGSLRRRQVPVLGDPEHPSRHHPSVPGGGGKEEAPETETQQEDQADLRHSPPGDSDPRGMQRKDGNPQGFPVPEEDPQGSGGESESQEEFGE